MAFSSLFLRHSEFRVSFPIFRTSDPDARTSLQNYVTRSIRRAGGFVLVAIPDLCRYRSRTTIRDTPIAGALARIPWGFAPLMRPLGEYPQSPPNFTYNSVY
jgi:hypothetical protein